MIHENLELIERIERYLSSIKINTKAVLDAYELELYTGLSYSAITKLTSANQIPFSKPCGKKIYFSKEEIDQWLMSNSNKTEYQLVYQASLTKSEKGGLL